MEGHIDLNTLDLRELAGVVNIYPWFALARLSLCRRLSSQGQLGQNLLAEASLYLSEPALLGSLLRDEQADYSDKNIQSALDSIVEQPQSRPRVVVAGGDYFTQEEYEKQSKSGFEDFSVSSHSSYTAAQASDFCTETLAQIYQEQGYFEQAKDIYSKLSLAYPEKSAYFADLIRKIDSENQNL